MENLVTDSNVLRLFGNISSIVKIHEGFLNELENRFENFNCDKTKIGEIFVSFVPLLSIYVDYCCNYGICMQRISKLKQEDNLIYQILLKAGLESNNMDLQDFCITPVQRLPRYRLLLDSLINSTHQEHPDFASIILAQHMISEKALEINKKMNLAEQQNNMMQLYLRFVSHPLTDQDLIQPWRFLSSEFKVYFLNSQPSNSQKHLEYEKIEAFIHLFNDIFIISKEETNTDTDQVPSRLHVLTAQPLWPSYLKKVESHWNLSKNDPVPFQIVNPSGCWNILFLQIEEKLRFKTEFENLREIYLNNNFQKKQQRSLIKLFPNDESQEWNAVEPAPTFASNRVSIVELAAETTEFTKMALEELLKENKDVFESRIATPSKTNRKSRLMKFKEEMNKVMTPKKFGTLQSPFQFMSTDKKKIDISTPSKSVNKNFKTPNKCDKENSPLNLNQADVIRSTIEKLSQAKSMLSPKLDTPKSELPEQNHIRKLRRTQRSTPLR